MTIVFIWMEYSLKLTDKRLKELNSRLSVLRERSEMNPAAAIAYQERSAEIEDQIDSLYDRFNFAFKAMEERIGK